MHLAETLALMKEYEYAIQSFELVATMTPQIPKIYRWLIDLNEIVGNKEKANHYKALLHPLDKGEKTIITGSPGLKLKQVLSLLTERGIKIGGDITDILGNNTSLLDKDWFSGQKENMIYVPMQFLSSLNAFYAYKFIYVNEDIHHVAEEINAEMKIKQGTFNTDLIEALKKQQNVSRLWIAQQPNLDIIYVNDSQDLDNELFKKFII